MLSSNNSVLKFILLCLVCLIVLYTLFTSSIISNQIQTRFCFKNNNQFENKLLSDIIEDQKRVPFGERLFYNRVPKCGSTTLLTLLRDLSKPNGFKHYNSKVYDKRMLDFSQQEILIEELMQFSTPYSYDRHIFFIDLAEHKLPNPFIYINLIRDPIERIISSFYYRRSVALRQSSTNTTNGLKSNDLWIKKTFRSCVLNGDPECVYNDNNSYAMSLMPYFCGQNTKCLQLSDKWALKEAKHNIEEWYEVIGVLEHMDITLKVLENRLPKFFAGVSRLYFQKKQIHKNENKCKHNVESDVKQHLRANLTNEYDLYEFAVQRLFSQYNQIKN